MTRYHPEGSVGYNSDPYYYTCGQTTLREFLDGMTECVNDDCPREHIYVEGPR